MPLDRNHDVNQAVKRSRVQVVMVLGRCSHEATGKIRKKRKFLDFRGDRSLFEFGIEDRCRNSLPFSGLNIFRFGTFLGLKSQAAFLRRFAAKATPGFLEMVPC